MNRLSARVLALVALSLLPSAAFAQKEPPHTKETKNAERFLGLAMTRNDAAQRRQYLEQALPSLLEARAKDPENGRVWFMLGSVQASIGNLAAADSAFDRAQAMYAGYAEAIEAERHAAWEVAFNNAVGLINAQKTDEGIVALENAELIYGDRPEAKYYLGLFYMQKQQVDNAERAFNAAIASVNGPLRPKLPAAAAEDWDKLALNSKIRLSNLMAFRGAELYDKQNYDSAAVVFANARRLSPYSRDHLFNELQSVYARALDLDKERTKAKNAALDARAKELYTSVLMLTDSLRVVDPRNEDIYFFSSRAHKVLSDLNADAALKTKHVNALRSVNTEYEQLPFVVSDVQIAEGDSTATVSGTIRNKLLKAGATGTFVFELVGFDGKPIGSAPVTFTATAAPAANQEAPRIPFKAVVPMGAPLASWRYRLQP
jgi:tetratricopeptide (TPR) repeat protein